MFADLPLLAQSGAYMVSRLGRWMPLMTTAQTRVRPVAATADNASWRRRLSPATLGCFAWSTAQRRQADQWVACR